MQKIAEQLAAQKAARQKANPVELLPKEVMVLMFTYIHECALTVHVPRLSKQWRDMTRVVWQMKCTKIGKMRKPLDLSWRRYYYADDLKLFPFHSATIGVTTYEEFARTHKLTPDESQQWLDRHFRYEKVVFTFGNEDNVLRKIDFNETSNDVFPIFWEIQGISWHDFALNRVAELFSNTNRNYILQGLPKEDQWTGYKSYTIVISSIIRIHETLFYEIKFEYLMSDDHYHPTLVKKFEMVSDPEKLDEYRERYMKMRCIIEYLDRNHSSYITHVDTTIADVPLDQNLSFIVNQTLTLKPNFFNP